MHRYPSTSILTCDLNGGDRSSELSDEKINHRKFQLLYVSSLKSKEYHYSTSQKLSSYTIPWHLHSVFLCVQKKIRDLWENDVRAICGRHITLYFCVVMDFAFSFSFFFSALFFLSFLSSFFEKKHLARQRSESWSRNNPLRMRDRQKGVRFWRVSDFRKVSVETIATSDWRLQSEISTHPVTWFRMTSVVRYFTRSNLSSSCVSRHCRTLSSSKSFRVRCRDVRLEIWDSDRKSRISKDARKENYESSTRKTAID